MNRPKRKIQIRAIILCLIVLLSACNKSKEIPPFPYLENEYDQPKTKSFEFSKPDTLQWVTSKLKALPTKFFSWNKIPSKPIDACLAIRKAINNADIGIGLESYKPQVSIGINSGDMIWGNIGSSTLRRLDYTVIGDAVNVASRLQSAAGKGKILISEANYLRIKDSFNCKKVGEIKMKNKKLPLTVFEVIS